MTTKTKYNVDFKTIGQRIKAIREAKPWTQAVLAHKMGYSVTYVSQVERDKYAGGPSNRAIRAFEKALGCKLMK